MRTYLILFLLFSFNINADELDVFFEALNKDYLFNEIVYENELAIQKSNGEIIKKKNLDVTNKLSEFLENAEHNQNLFLKIQNLILKIISQTNLNDLADFVESFFQEELKTEICKIYFFTPENSFNLETKRVITPEIATSIFSDLFKTAEISLGSLNDETSSLVFGAQANIVEGAIGKLKSSKIAGTLALGSSEIGKFPKDSETLFLEFVIAVFSNQIDKILPSTNE